MKKTLQSLALLVVALIVPTVATAAPVQVADGVYCDGSTLYIGSGVTSLGALNLNPSVIYCFATVPPVCVSNTFSGYEATLHIPAASYGAYFINEYWSNFGNMYNDAVEPTGVTLSSPEANMTAGETMTLTANVAPSNASLKTVTWSSSNSSVATVSGGVVTALAAGECDIIATCLDLKAVCHVKVTQTTIVITLDKHEARLLPNHSVTITPTMTPMETTLKVTVSNPEVAAARLVNGVVQVVGLAEGSTMIVVSSVDGQAVPDACQVTVYTELGDVNCDGFVNIADVTNLIDHLLGSSSGNFKAANADANDDGSVNIADVTALIDYLLMGHWPWDAPVYETFTVNGVTFKMVAVEGGTFTMGATAEQGSDANDWEKPAHEVTLSSYSIGETEVTQALWQAVMGSNPSRFKSDLNRPVETVSWNDCQTFIIKLNDLTGLHFRLPTEAEWEYAARGGNRSKSFKYAGSNDINEVAWFCENSNEVDLSSPDYGTHTVGTKAPNELGLYDLSGNVEELCQDWCGSYSSQKELMGLKSLSIHATRGGNWMSGAQSCRVSSRFERFSYEAYEGLGLRLAFDGGKFRLSESIVILSVGERKSVNILNGNGDYKVDGDEDNVTSIVNGNILTVTGANLGTTTVRVTDVSTGATTVLTVIVNECQRFMVNGVIFKMVTVEGGSFNMGATEEQVYDADDEEMPVHEVTLSTYSIGETEVTQELWQAVMGCNPSYFSPTYGNTENLQRPVEMVSWEDCQTFITKLNELTGKNFRLPTEAEWEYAARGGNRSLCYKYVGSNSIGDVAWFADICFAMGSSNPDYGTHTVAAKAPNEIGLYDMSGNVWEYCQDWYGGYTSEPQISPTGPITGSSRVLRGGSWDNGAINCRVSSRGQSCDSFMSFGLRLVL